MFFDSMVNKGVFDRRSWAEDVEKMLPIWRRL